MKNGFSRAKTSALFTTTNAWWTTPPGWLRSLGRSRPSERIQIKLPGKKKEKLTQPRFFLFLFLFPFILISAHVKNRVCRVLLLVPFWFILILNINKSKNPSMGLPTTKVELDFLGGYFQTDLMVLSAVKKGTSLFSSAFLPFATKY